jgi:uncharacterized Tic20 family protein
MVNVKTFFISMLKSFARGVAGLIFVIIITGVLVQWGMEDPTQIDTVRHYLKQNSFDITLIRLAVFTALIQLVLPMKIVGVVKKEKGDSYDVSVTGKFVTRAQNYCWVSYLLLEAVFFLRDTNLFSGVN